MYLHGQQIPIRFRCYICAYVNVPYKHAIKHFWLIHQVLEGHYIGA